MQRSHTPAVLLVHGLGGTACDLGSLGRELDNTGFVTECPLLPGHGGAPEALIGLHFEDWIACITDAYRDLKQRHRTVHIAGFCLGALVALEVAKREQHTDRLILLSPPLFLDGWSLPGNRMLRHVVYRMGRLAERMTVPEAEPFGIKNPRIRNLIRARFARGDRFHMPYIPLSVIRTVDALRTTVKRRLDTMRCSTLIVHAHEDEITSIRSARHLARHMGGQVELVELHDSYHMILMDNERDKVMQRTTQFLLRGSQREDSSVRDARARALLEESPHPVVAA